MTIKESIPPHILSDLCNPETYLYIAPNWKVQYSQGEIWLYNESAGSHSYTLDSSAYKIIRLVDSKGASVHDIQREKIGNWLATAMDLWTADIIRLRNNEQEDYDGTETSSRYIWFDEYLGRYASPSFPLRRMRENLATSKICLIGLGGFGSTLALSLAAHGVGSLRLVDGDIIESSNLPRQILYTEKSIGQPKAEILREAILSNNSAVKIDSDCRYVHSMNDALDVVNGCDFVVLGADQPRLHIRNWVGKACLEHKVPHLFMAGAWVGPLTVPGLSPCHACVGRSHGTRISDAKGWIESLSIDHQPPRASFGPRPLILAGYMASAILHFLTGIDREQLLYRRFRHTLFGGVEEEHLVRYRNCPICG